MNKASATPLKRSTFSLWFYFCYFFSSSPLSLVPCTVLGWWLLTNDYNDYNEYLWNNCNEFLLYCASAASPRRGISGEIIFRLSACIPNPLSPARSTRVHAPQTTSAPIYQEAVPPHEPHLLKHLIQNKIFVSQLKLPKLHVIYLI